MKLLLRWNVAGWIALVLVFSGCNAIARLSPNYPFDDRKFDSAIWKAYDKSLVAENPRGQMIDDLFDNYLHKGMSREEVINLLGKPDFASRPDFYCYNIGIWSSWIDNDSLDLKFDDSGQLIDLYWKSN